jgi:hypothetical protein
VKRLRNGLTAQGQTNLSSKRYLKVAIDSGLRVKEAQARLLLQALARPRFPERE